MGEVIMNQDFENLLEELKELLMKHDKYFDFTDDHAVWRKGFEEWQQIDKLSTNLKLAGYTDEVKVLFDTFYH